jgi:hypothetical protein
MFISIFPATIILVPHLSRENIAEEG